MSKFKVGDTVYIKGFIKEDDKSNIPYRIGLLSEFFWAKPEEVFTKEEMLAELNKPELPKVGEAWNNGSQTVKIVFIKNDHLLCEYNSETLGLYTIKEFLRYGYTKVEE